jgi:transcription antitermination factor NusG
MYCGAECAAAADEVRDWRRNHEPKANLWGTGSRLTRRMPRSPVTRTAEGRAEGERWYALRVCTRRETRIQTELQKQQIEAYFPTFPEESRWSDRVKVIDRPLFPGYLFCRMDLARGLDVLQITGVLQILASNLSPQPIPDHEIEGVRRAVESNLPCGRCPYVAGNAVTVLSGPLAGQTGIVKRSKGTTRLIVVLTLLNRAVSVEIDAADLTLQGKAA